MNRSHAPLTALDRAVIYLQLFGGVGTRFQNPQLSISNEYKASCVDGQLAPNSRFGRLSAHAYNEELRIVKDVADRYWKGERSIEVEQLLKQLLEDDRPWGKPDTPSGSVRVPNLPLRPNCELFICAVCRKQRGVFRLSKEERKAYPLTPEQIIDEFENMVKDAMTLDNPLISLRMVDDQSQEPLLDPASRKQVLSELEDLSSRLWHHAPTLDVETLRVRVLLQSTCGAHDLMLLKRYADLTNLSSRLREVSAHPGFPTLENHTNQL